MALLLRPYRHVDRQFKRRVNSFLRLSFFILVGSLFGLILSVKYAAGHFYSESNDQMHYQKLKLLSNGTEELPVWETCDEEKESGIQYVLAAIWLFLTFWLFVALAIICDDFFVPSLEEISDRLSLTEDVAGATFMAAGSSAPELFTSIAGVSFESDVGVGTIVGSAIFNLLIIIALSSALAGQILHIDWRPLTRDTIFYALSIIAFIVFAFDGEVALWEAIILLLLYLSYVAIMFVNPTLMKFLSSIRQCLCNKVAPSKDDSDGKELHAHDNPAMEKEVDANEEQHKFHHTSQLVNSNCLRTQDVVAEEHATTPERQSVATPNDIKRADNSFFPQISHSRRESRLSHVGNEILDANTRPESIHGDNDKEEEEEEEYKEIIICSCLPGVPLSWPELSDGMCSYPRYVGSWFLFILAFPWALVFAMTIPNCSKPHLKKFFIFSFVMSVFWIAICSFILVLLIGRAGCILDIDTFIMGLIIVAIGTSVPDALSSIIVARDGFGDMAVSNAIGSNVFDINLGLGLPFVIRMLIDWPNKIQLISAQEKLLHETKYSGNPFVPHVKFGLILLFVLILCMLVFIAVRFKLNKWVGISFVLMYIIFIAYAIFQEFACDSGYGC